MLLGAGSYPSAVHWARGVSCGGCNELVCCRTKRTIRTKGNSLEANVEALLLDDLVRAAILGGQRVTQAASRPPQSVRRVYEVRAEVNIIWDRKKSTVWVLSSQF